MTTEPTTTTTAPANRWDTTRAERLRLQKADADKRFELLDHGFDALIESIEKLLPRKADGTPDLEHADFAAAEQLLEYFRDYSGGAAGSAQSTPDDTAAGSAQSTPDDTAAAPKGFRPAWRLPRRSRSASGTKF